MPIPLQPVDSIISEILDREWCLQNLVIPVLYRGEEPHKFLKILTGRGDNSHSDISDYLYSRLEGRADWVDINTCTPELARVLLGEKIRDKKTSSYLNKKAMILAGLADYGELFGIEAIDPDYFSTARIDIHYSGDILSSVNVTSKEALYAAKPDILCSLYEDTDTTELSLLHPDSSYRQGVSSNNLLISKKARELRQSFRHEFDNKASNNSTREPASPSAKITPDAFTHKETAWGDYSSGVWSKYEHGKNVMAKVIDPQQYKGTAIIYLETGLVKIIGNGLTLFSMKDASYELFTEQSRNVLVKKIATGVGAGLVFGILSGGLGFLAAGAGLLAGGNKKYSNIFIEHRDGPVLIMSMDPKDFMYFKSAFR